MNSFFLDSTPLAIGIALSPLAIVSVSVMLSQGNRRGGLWFLLGWAAGLTALSLLVALYGQTLGQNRHNFIAPWLAPVQVMMGVIILVWALLSIVRYRNAPPPAELPKVLRSVNAMGPAKSFGMATFMAGANVKNIGLLLVFFVALLASQRPFVWALASVLAFILVASITIAVPVLYAVVRGPAADPMLERWQGWLLAYQGTIVNVFLALVGVALIARGWAR